LNQDVFRAFDSGDIRIIILFGFRGCFSGCLRIYFIFEKLRVGDLVAKENLILGITSAKVYFEKYLVCEIWKIESDQIFHWWIQFLGIFF
jgi:hypothetical protein